MIVRVLILVTLAWWSGSVGTATAYESAAVFPMSRIESVDFRNQLLTFKTREGQVWVLRVAASSAMKRDTFAKGDLVRIEVDLDDQIVKIVKLDGAGRSDRDTAQGR